VSKIKPKTLNIIELAIKYINDNPGLYDKEKATFNSLANFIKESDEIDGKLDISTVIEHRVLFGDAGFVFSGKNEEKKAKALLLLESAVKYINNNPEAYRKKEAGYTTLAKFIKGCNEIEGEVNASTITKYSSLLEKKGFVFVGLGAKKRAEKSLLAVESTIKFINDNPGLYDKKFANNATLASFMEKHDEIDGKVDPTTIASYRSLFEKEGFVFAVQKIKPEESVRIAKLAIEYVNSNPEIYDKEDATFGSLANFIKGCDEIDGKVSSATIQKHRHMFEEEGFVFGGAITSGLRVKTIKIISSAIEYINKNPKSYNKKEASFKSLTRFIKESAEIDGEVSPTAISSQRILLEEAGFAFVGNTNTQEKCLSIIKSAIKYISGNPGAYDKKKAEYGSMADFIKGCNEIDGEISASTIVTHKHLFKEAGFMFRKDRHEKTRQVIRSAIEYINDHPELCDKKKAEFNPLARIISDCSQINGELTGSQISHYRSIFEKEGFVFVARFNSAAQVLATLESAIRFIGSNPETYNKKEANFKSLTRFIKESAEIDGEVSVSSVKSYKDLFEEKGFVFTSTAKREKDTQHLAVNVFREHFKNQDIRFNSPEAFRELCSDFYNTTIKLDIITGNFRLAPYPQVTAMESDNIINVLHDIVEEGTSNQDSLLLMEFKALLLAKYKLYIDEETILSVLRGLELSEILDSFEGLEARLRLSETLIGADVVKVSFHKSLPDINSSDAIVLHQKLKNKKYFRETWYQYCEFIISHGMESYTGKLAIKDKATKPEDLKGTQKDGLLLNQWQAEKFDEYGIELLVAMTLYPKKTHEVKSVLNQHKGVVQKVLGYFVWLYYQGLALLTPRIIKTDKTRNSQSTQTKMLEYFIDKNNAFRVFKEKLKDDRIGSSDLTHLYAFCHSVNNGYSAKNLSQNDFDSYMESCGHYINSGNKRHINFMHNYMKKVDNHNITKTKKQKSVFEQFVDYASSVSNACLEAYGSFIRSSLLTVESLTCSMPYKYSHIRNLVFLLEYIDSVHGGRRLSKKEFGRALNPKDRDDDYVGIREWAISMNALRSNDTVLQETRARGTFSEILYDEDNPYYDTYSQKWKSINATYELRSGTSSYIERIAHDRTASSECARVCLGDPPLSSYPFKMTTGEGEPIELDWWKHDTSPVPSFLILIGVTIPLRWIQVRHLDLRTFFRTTNGDIDGEFDGFYINTDKNTSRSDPYVISANIVKKLLRPYEIEAIRNYVKYVRKCYGYKPVCAHDTQSERYPDIQPLFPHHDISVNKVYSGNWLEGYLTKIMCVSAINIRNNSEEKIVNVAGVSKNDPRFPGLLDKYKDLQLVMQRSDATIPETIEKVNAITDYNFREDFKPYGGTHSWRHTGITSLARLGWPASVIKQITGHASILTILQVYERLDAEGLLTLFDAKHFDFEKMIDMSPLESGYEMQKTITRVANTLEKTKIFELLKEAEFVGTSGYIHSGSKDLFGDIGDIEIGDPVEFAAQYHPLHEWKVLSEGVCPVHCNCPGQSMACGNCPLLISSPLNLGAIIHKINILGIQVSDNNNVLLELRENRRSGSNNRLEELTAKQIEYFDEYVGWLEKLEKLRIHIEAIRQDSLDVPVSHNANSSFVTGSAVVQFANQVPIDEAYLNVLSDAYRKHLEGFDTDRIKNRAFALMVSAKTQQRDIDANELSMQFLDKLIGQVGLSENKQEKIAMICNAHFRTVGGGRLAGKENMLPWSSAGALPNERSEEVVQ